MDFDDLVNEIINRVAEKMQEQSPQETTIVCDDKPRLLILTQEHGDFCHTMLESAKLGEYYHVECALLQEYKCDPTNYEAAILFGLTNDVLGKLAGGICDTPFTMLAQKLILSGKKVFAPAEDIELYSYEESAPPAYYAMMESKLDFLKSCGVTVCKQENLEDVILNGAESCCNSSQPCKAEATPTPEVTTQPTPKPAEKPAEASLDKKVITEKDMIAVCTPGVTVLRIRKNSIVTDLAQDYAHTRRITIRRD